MKRIQDKIKDLVEPQSFDQIGNYADDPARALAAYRFTDVTSDLLSRWLDALALGARGGGAALALAGARGVGKSHTLAAFGALAGSERLRSTVEDAHVAAVAGRLTGVRCAVVRVERGTRPTLEGEVAAAFARVFGGGEAQWAGTPGEMLSAAASRASGESLVVLVDTAFNRPARVARDDGPPLGDLAVAARSAGAFVALALDDDIAGADGPNVALAGTYHIDYLDPENLFRVAEQFVLRKKPQGRGRVRDIYNELRATVPHFNWSEARFASLYPVHPLVAEVAAGVRLYVPGFAFLPFAAGVAAQAAARPALSLVLLDEVFDATEEALRKSEDLGPAFAAYDRLTANCVNRLPVMQRHQARLILKSLFVLSLDGRGATAGELCAALLLTDELARSGAVRQVEEIIARFAEESGPEDLARAPEPDGQTRYRFHTPAGDPAGLVAGDAPAEAAPAAKAPAGTATAEAATAETAKQTTAETTAETIAETTSAPAAETIAETTSAPAAVPAPPPSPAPVASSSPAASSSSPAAPSSPTTTPQTAPSETPTPPFAPSQTPAPAVAPPAQGRVPETFARAETAESVWADLAADESLWDRRPKSRSADEADAAVLSPGDEPEREPAPAPGPAQAGPASPAASSDDDGRGRAAADILTAEEEAAAEALTEWARRLTGRHDLPSVAREAGRENVRAALAAWLEEWRALGLEGKFESLPAVRLTTLAGSYETDVRRSFGRAARAVEEALAGRARLEECLERVAGSFRRSAEVFAARSRQLSDFCAFVDGFARRERLRAYLAHAETTGIDEIETARRELSQVAARPNSLLDAAQRERFEKLWREFHARYVEHYAAAHDRALAGEGARGEVWALRRGPLWREFEQLARLPLMSAQVWRRAEEALRRAGEARCDFDVRRLLEERPVCACRFRLGRSGESGGTIEELREVAERGVAVYRRTLLLLGGHLAIGLDALARRETDEKEVRRARALSSAFAQSRLPERLGRADVRLIERALRRTPAPPVRVSTPEAEAGPSTREELRARLESWLDELPERPVLIEVVSEGEARAV
ncbi:MAG TPA: DUF6079 family protein [Pyrinomonadaceae bacterium]|nr:DUF6079 family protein [Pyrinomonadaceae bacterium]